MRDTRHPWLALLTGFRAAAGRTHVDELAVLSGAMLVGWIGVQLIVIRTFSWLQPAMVVAGLGVFAAGWWLRTRTATRL